MDPERPSVVDSLSHGVRLERPANAKTKTLCKVMDPAEQLRIQPCQHTDHAGLRRDWPQREWSWCDATEMKP